MHRKIARTAGIIPLTAVRQLPRSVSSRPNLRWPFEKTPSVRGFDVRLQQRCANVAYSGDNIVNDTVHAGIVSIKALALDVDGVLTDGTFWWNAAGDEWKRFSFIDVMGLARAKRAGLLVTLISGEDSELVDRFAAKLDISDYAKGCKDKAAALRAYATRNHLALTEICFMGDDVNDLDAMALAGLAAAPANARETVLRKAAFVSTAPGGNGAVRELVEAIISARELEAIVG